jgi:tetratricopeptide (TPR) repeat protein
MRKRPLVVTAICVPYLSVQLFVLYQTTSVWGEPPVAAELWHRAHPASERATQMLAKQRTAFGDQRGALQVIDAALAANPSHPGFAMQGLQLSCSLESQEVFARRQTVAMSTLARGPRTFAAVGAIDRLMLQVESRECLWISLVDLRTMIDLLLTNTKYRGDAKALSGLHQLRARAQSGLGDHAGALLDLEAAFAADPQIEIGVLVVGLMHKIGKRDDALRRLDELASMAPRNPIVRKAWELELERVRSALLSAGIKASPGYSATADSAWRG